jgi:hypothetical protein
MFFPLINLFFKYVAKLFKESFGRNISWHGEISLGELKDKQAIG